MYAIIEDSGKQFKVEKDNEILVDIRDVEVGGEIVFDKVVAIGNDGSLETQTSRLKKVKVIGAVIRFEKGKKINIGKFKRRKKYHKRQGHRHKYIRVRIAEISG